MFQYCLMIAFLLRAWHFTLFLWECWGYSGEPPAGQLLQEQPADGENPGDAGPQQQPASLCGDNDSAHFTVSCTFR